MHLFILPLVLASIHIHIKQHTTIREPMNNYKNLQYSGEIVIGGQKQIVIFDTGSSLLWVRERGFNCQESADCLQTEDSYTICYGSGEVNGIRATDQVTIANMSIECPFLIVKRDDMHLRANGILGLAPQSQPQFPSFVSLLYKKGYIEIEQFALFLNKLPEEVNNQSMLMLGGYDKQLIQSEPVFTQTISSTQWMIGFEQITINNQNLELTSRKALIDSGTSLIVLPTHDFSQLLHSLRVDYLLFCQYSALQIQCSCPEADITAFPEFKIIVNSNLILTLEPKDYITLYVSTCVLSFGKSSSEYWILGDVVFRKYVTIFQQGQIGFAEAVKFNKQDKLIQMNDTLYVFKVLLACICTAMVVIWLIRKVSNLGGSNDN